MNLYITGTPIGNLDDMSYRQISTLKEVDVILAEDTRVSRKLLNYFEIDTKLVSYHDYNKETATKKIIEEMKTGTTFALISDAGMPIISDPGFELVQEMQKENLEYTVIPGASAFTMALILSGIPSFEFTYFGFLPKSNQKKREKLEEILYHDKTAVLYESPHRIKTLVQEISEHDSERIISVSREISKKFEQTLTLKAKEMHEKLGAEMPLKGEFVIVISGYEEKEVEYDADIFAHVESFIEAGMKTKAAIKEVAHLRGMKTQEVYDLYHTKK